SRVQAVARRGPRRTRRAARGAIQTTADGAAVAPDAAARAAAEAHEENLTEAVPGLRLRLYGERGAVASHRRAWLFDLRLRSDRAIASAVRWREAACCAPSARPVLRLDEGERVDPPCLDVLLHTLVNDDRVHRLGEAEQERTARG